jgi:hypothetical protein
MWHRVICQFITNVLTTPTGSNLYPEDEDSMNNRNAGNYLPDYTTSHSKDSFSNQQRDIEHQIKKLR